MFIHTFAGCRRSIVPSIHQAHQDHQVSTKTYFSVLSLLTRNHKFSHSVHQNDGGDVCLPDCGSEILL